MHSRRVRQASAVLTLGLLPLACDDASNSEPSNPATTSPTSNTSQSANTNSATTAPSTGSTAASSTLGSSADATTAGGGAANIGGAANTGGAPTDTSGGTESNTTASTTGGEPPNGTAYVFTGSTNGSLRAFVMDPSDGSLEAAGSAETGQGLDFVALGPDDRTLFIARESTLAAYTYDPTNESFTAGDETATQGSGTYVNVDPTGGFVFVASYNEGLLSWFSYDDQAGFSEIDAVAAGMNAHQVRLDVTGRHVYVPCLGENYVAEYDFDPSSGELTEGAPPASAEGGPRHMTFHPSAPVVYVLTENSSQVHVYDVDEASGALELRPDDSIYTAEDGMRHWSSDIQITPDGNYVYAVNRDDPEIVRFEVQADHSLTRLGSDGLQAVVRAFAVDPAGGYLQLGDADGNLVAYRIDADTGSLSETASVAGLGDVHATIIRYLE